MSSNDSSQYTRDIVVIGVSAGGVPALMDLVSNLSPDLTATLFIVQHMPPYAKSNLSRILNAKSRIPAEEAADGLAFERGKIYCSLNDRHLILENGKMLISKGPKENRFRPSIDALFRSAAYEYKERVIGVILSGALNDGTAGMCTIKRFNGLALVQSPAEAVFDSMPLEVGRYAEVDYTMPAADLGTLISQLTSQTVPDSRELAKTQDDMLKMEIEIAKNKNALELGVFENRQYTPLTCPDCQGALVKISEHGIIRFRCHTGHGFTADALLAGVTENIEKDLWRVMRGLEEGNMVLQHLAREFTKLGNLEMAENFSREAGVLIRKSRNIHQIINNAEVMSVEG